MKLKAIVSLIAVAVVLAVVFYAVSRPSPAEPVTPRPFVWEFEMEDLQRIEISLPKDPNIPNSRTWIKHEDRYFYFDEPNPSKVDMVRWGGGVPLILSGPGAERLLFEDATTEKLKELGFEAPLVLIKLTLADNTEYNIEVADPTPSGQAYYIRQAGAHDVYTVDYTWFDVVTRLVREPPYQPAAIITDRLTISPTETGPSQRVVITAEMVNNGVVSGSLEVKLKVNGVVEATKTVNLERAQRETVVFTTQKDKPGTYSVNVEGVTGKFVIK